MELSTEQERELRAATTRSIFRAVNEEIRAVNRSFTVSAATFAITCECADAECVAMFEIAPESYDRVRSHPHRFAVLPGHVPARVERVVEESGAYVVVENVSLAAEVAEALDARLAEA